MIHGRIHIAVWHVLFWTIYSIYFYLINWLGNPCLALSTVLMSIPFFISVFYMVLFALRELVVRGKWIKGSLLLLLVWSLGGSALFLLTYGWDGTGLIYEDYVLADKPFKWGQFMRTFLMMVVHYSFLALVYFLLQSRLNEARGRLRERNLRERFEFTSMSIQLPTHFLMNVFLEWEGQLSSMDLKIKGQLRQMYRLVQYIMLSSDPRNQKTVVLTNELEQVEYYISMQKAISPKPLFLEIEIRGNASEATIPSTSLLTLVMNQISHGELTNADDPGRIRIRVERDYYSVLSCNQTKDSSRIRTGHGYGLQQLQGRLEYVFGSSFSMQVKIIKDHYYLRILVETQ